MEQVTEEVQGMELSAENVDTVRAAAGSSHPASRCPLRSRCLLRAPRSWQPRLESAPAHSAPSPGAAVTRIRPSSYGQPLLIHNQPLSPIISQVLGEIRPYLVGTGGGGLELDAIEGPIVKVKITGPAANVMTVRVAGAHFKSYVCHFKVGCSSAGLASCRLDMRWRQDFAGAAVCARLKCLPPPFSVITQ